jgi:hypothetical protein
METKNNLPLAGLSQKHWEIIVQTISKAARNHKGKAVDADAIALEILEALEAKWIPLEDETPEAFIENL